MLGTLALNGLPGLQGNYTYLAFKPLHGTPGVLRALREVKPKR